MPPRPCARSAWTWLCGNSCPKSVAYDDSREILVDGRSVRVPARAELADVRGADTLRVALTIEDAIGTDTRRQTPGGAPFGEKNAGEERGDPTGGASGRPYFIQMKGTARISGRVGGAPVEGSGRGFFETYR